MCIEQLECHTSALAILRPAVLKSGLIPFWWQSSGYRQSSCIDQDQTSPRSVEPDGDSTDATTAP